MKASLKRGMSPDESSHVFGQVRGLGNRENKALSDMSGAGRLYVISNWIVKILMKLEEEMKERDELERMWAKDIAAETKGRLFEFLRAWQSAMGIACVNSLLRDGVQGVRGVTT